MVQINYYFKKTLDSFKALKKNLVLFVPSIIYLIITTILATILLNISAKPLLEVVNLQDPQQITNAVLAIVGTSESAIKFGISIGIFVLTTFFIGASLKSMDIYMYKDVLKTGKASLKKAFKNKNLYFWRIIGIRTTIFLIALIPLTIITLITLISPVKNLYIIATIPLALIGIYIYLSFFFVYPILAIENKGVIETIKLSHKYFRSNLRHILYTLLTITLLSIVFTVITSPVSLLIRFIEKLVINFLIITYLTITINYLVRLVLDLWIDLIVFFVYKTKQKT